MANVTQQNSKFQNRKIAFFTQGEKVPSRKFRAYQYFPILSEYFKVEEFYTKQGAYPPAKHLNKASWFFENINTRYSQIRKVNKSNFDLIFLQRELISSLMTLECLFEKPIILDVDDAIYLNSRFGGIKNISQKAEKIICGNQFLANHFQNWNSNIEILPTAVNENKYLLKNSFDFEKDTIKIIWSGSSSGFFYLTQIETALDYILKLHSNCELIILSDKRPIATFLKGKYTFYYWSEELEIKLFKESDIGLMPIDNSDWSRGKCSFKLLTYMAAGLVPVFSNYGMNNEMLSHGTFGMPCTDTKSWIESLNDLILDMNLRKTFSKISREIIVEHYSIDIVSQKLINILN